jgi:hypothetical protein
MILLPVTGLTGSMNSVRYDFEMVLLPSGQVFSVGGFFSLPNGELFDPATGTWTLTGAQNHPRNFTRLNLLRNSKVLVTGCLRRETELYDPASATFSDTGLMTEVRSEFLQTMLDDGRVLVAGGQKVKGSRFKYFASTEIYNPDNGVWSRTIQ